MHARSSQGYRDTECLCSFNFVATDLRQSVCVCAFVNSTLCGKSYVGDGHCGECLHCGENIVSPQ